MPLFGISRRRSVHHCLMFDRKTTGTLSPRERIAMFQTVEPAPSPAAGNGILGMDHTWIMKGQNVTFPNGVFSKSISITAMELMNWRPASARYAIRETLAKRRNAVCSEIERAWFLQGSHLEKHRHNLLATHKLQCRGLMAW